MWPIATDVVAWSVCLCVSVCLYVMGMIPAKTAEPIQMPVNIWAWVGPHNHVLDGDPDPPREGAVP